MYKENHFDLLQTDSDPTDWTRIRSLFDGCPLHIQLDYPIAGFIRTWVYYWRWSYRSPDVYKQNQQSLFMGVRPNDKCYCSLGRCSGHGINCRIKLVRGAQLGYSYREGGALPSETPTRVSAPGSRWGTFVPHQSAPLPPNPLYATGLMQARNNENLSPRGRK